MTNVRFHTSIVRAGNYPQSSASERVPKYPCAPKGHRPHHLDQPYPESCISERSKTNHALHGCKIARASSDAKKIAEQVEVGYGAAQTCFRSLVWLKLIRSPASTSLRACHSTRLLVHSQDFSSVLEEFASWKSVSFRVLSQFIVNCISRHFGRFVSHFILKFSAKTLDCLSNDKGLSLADPQIPSPDIVISEKGSHCRSTVFDHSESVHPLHFACSRQIRQLPHTRKTHFRFGQTESSNFLQLGMGGSHSCLLRFRATR